MHSFILFPLKEKKSSCRPRGIYVTGSIWREKLPSVFLNLTKKKKLLGKSNSVVSCVVDDDLCRRHREILRYTSGILYSADSSSQQTLTGSSMYLSLRDGAVVVVEEGSVGDLGVRATRLCSDSKITICNNTETRFEDVCIMYFQIQYY